MPRIFISYRRDDSAGHTRRVYDQLSDYFGPDQVFMDVDTISPGRDPDNGRAVFAAVRGRV